MYFFNKKSLLLKHQTTVHDKPMPFICTIDNCKKGFLRENDLVRHQNLGHKAKENSATTVSLKRRRSGLSENPSTEAISDIFEKNSEFSNQINASIKTIE